MTTRTNIRQRNIAIIGSGFSGLCVGIQLKKRGIDGFTIFEKAAALGGTWRDNTYPGAECDVPSVLYSFSFEPSLNWSHKWSEQKEILAYLEHCAGKYALFPHIRLNEEVTSLRFDETTCRWRLETAGGPAEDFDVVVSGVGQLDKPWIPAIEGAEDFGGASFHSARWNHDVPLEGKKVCCIGNAASAIQFIPQVAPRVEKLTVFQRSANWIVPKNDRAYTVFEKRLAAAVPMLPLLNRFYIWARAEALLFPLMFQNDGRLRRKSEQAARNYIDEKIRDPELRKKLVPDYPMGAKRILFSDDIYDALDRDNVEVVTSPIARIEADGVMTTDGRLHEAHVIIYATGFETTKFLTPMRVEGRNGAVLNEIWEGESAEAYLGMTHTGFPNFFMMYGPNTNLGHNSIIVMIEAQTRYILSCLRALDARGAQWLDVKESTQKTFNQRMHRRLQHSVWAAVERNWYKNEQGKITNNWVGRTTEYRRLTRSVNPDDYVFAPAPAPDASEVMLAQNEG